MWRTQDTFLGRGECWRVRAGPGLPQIWSVVALLEDKRNREVPCFYALFAL